MRVEYRGHVQSANESDSEVSHQFDRTPLGLAHRYQIEGIRSQLWHRWALFQPKKTDRARMRGRACEGAYDRSNIVVTKHRSDERCSDPAWLCPATSHSSFTGTPTSSASDQNGWLHRYRRMTRADRIVVWAPCSTIRNFSTTRGKMRGASLRH